MANVPSDRGRKSLTAPHVERTADRLGSPRTLATGPFPISDPCCPCAVSQWNGGSR